MILLHVMRAEIVVCLGRECAPDCKYKKARARERVKHREKLSEKEREGERERGREGERPCQPKREGP